METTYVFNGHKFLEFVDSSTIIKEANEKISPAIDIDTKSKLGEFFEEVIKNNPKDRKVLNKIFFEHIMYSRLKNVFVDRFNTKENSLTVSAFKGKMKKIQESFNNEVRIPRDLFSIMNKDHYYLMDMLNVSTLGTQFIAGYDYTSSNNKVQTARFLFVQVVPRGTKIGYFIAGIDINFEEGTCLTMIRNITDIKEIEEGEVPQKKKEEEKEEFVTSFNRLYIKVKRMIIERLISIEDIEAESDKKGMYKLCTELLDSLLGNINQEVTQATEEEVNKSVQAILKKLFPNDNAFVKSNTKPLSKKLHSLLCSAFINQKYDTDDIVKIARHLVLKGYPTRIKFTSSRASRGSAQSGGSKIPVASTELFHSLYNEFENSSNLSEWSISWFVNYNNTKPEDCSVSQTTIYAKQTSFRIVFLQKKSINKEFIEHVVGQLNQYR
ncbi:hypothetical protein EXW29_09445 [Bacillus toyonensis]|uniref:hypothetical protein n=1 Tax=Bacillus toyonensis TaxID=155322 RepID=UPI001C01D5F6|nr:hypothetical protein [Bacillus toyonensis]QWH88397.1 hypothetical protein EXW29_09445 [Bacillus toyonensis]QWI31572.1 hypothetical protein EXW25_09435 [Bacillus toyonensis]